MMDTDRSSTRWISLLFLFLGLCLTAEVHAQEPNKAERLKQELDSPADNPDKREMRRMQKKQKGVRSAQPPQPSRSFLDINNATVTLDREGHYNFADPFTGSNNSFPRGTSGNTTFAQGFMFAGKVKDTTDTDTTRALRSGGATYFTGMKPGGVNEDGVPDNQEDAAKYHTWRVHRNWTDPSVQRESAAYQAGVEPSEVTDAAINRVREQYKFDWNNWPADQGAPFQDCNDNGTYEPAPPEAVNGGRTTCDDLQARGVDGDIPGKPKAEQTLWTVSNDMGSASLGEDISAIYGSPEIGIEVQYTVWGYERPPGTALGNIAFHQAKMIYAGKPSAQDVSEAGADYLSADAHPHPTPDDARIDSMFISWWVDPDVGTFSNDFVGVDTTTSLAYAYNAGPDDATFSSLGLAPAAVGFDFLKSTEVDPGEEPLTSFSFFAAGTRATDPALFEYRGTREWFNLMRGVLPQPPYPQGEPFINPITNEPAVYANSGDPVTRQGWIDGVFVGPSDRRMAPNTGPFSMTVGDTVSVTVAQVNGLGLDYLSSISFVRFYDRAAQFAFDADFKIPTPPPAPDVQATANDQKVSISWGGNNSRIRQIEEEYDAPAGPTQTYDFQGYRVYQLPSRTASLNEGELIETFDEADGILDIKDNVFNPDTRKVEEQTVQQLTDTGIKRNVVFERDRINSEPLQNGNDYYYAVTAFAYLKPDVPGIPSRVQESSPVRLSLRPQPPAPGVTDVPEVGDKPETNYSGSNSSPATTVSAEVVLPDSVKTTDYTITTGNSWGVQRGGQQLFSGVDFGESRVVDGVLVEVRDTTTTSGLDPNNDQWSISTSGKKEASEEKLKKEVKKIGVFPNPYRGFNELEDSRFDKFVRFTNLPSPDKGTTTIRIFTLSGNPVKVIRHDQSSANPNFEDWDLKNEGGTWVSSGLYLVHIDTPFGQKTLRLAVAMEEEVLNNY